MAETLLTLRTQIQTDMDLLASDGSLTRGNEFITPAEIDTHIRRAVKDATSLVHKIYEDYFFVPARAINIVSGTSEYALPTDMFINKIRRIFYNDGAYKYKVKRIINLNEIPFVTPTDDLKYTIINELGVGYRIKFYPTPTFSSATFVTMWYIRKAKELLINSDIIDIPDEVLNYVIANAKFRTLQKDVGNQMREEYKQERDEQMQLLLTILSNKIPDDEGGLYPDLSFYNESIL